MKIAYLTIILALAGCADSSPVDFDYRRTAEGPTPIQKTIEPLRPVIFGSSVQIQ